MTCCRYLARLFLVACLGLDGMLALAGCGGIRSKAPPLADASTADRQPLTDVARSGLAFTPQAPSFANTWQVGESSNTQAIASVVSLGSENVTVTLQNHSPTTDHGPVELSLGGNDADQFLVVRDECSAVTLRHGGGDDASCLVSVAFLPTLPGQKTAVLTATAGAEAAWVTITGTAVDAFAISIAPDQYVEAKDNAHDFGTVSQMSDKVWTAFTITHPSGAPKSAQVSFGLGQESDPAYKLADGTNHAFGTCGDSGTTTLAPGADCSFWVQFMPDLNVPVGDGKPLVGWIQATDEAKGKIVSVKGMGHASSIITMSPSSYTFPDAPIDTTSVAATLTVTNHGSTLVTLGIPPNGAALYPFNVDQDAGCAHEPRILASGATCPLVVSYVSQGIHTGPVKDRKLTVSATNTANARATTLLTGATVRSAKLVAVGRDNSLGDGDSIIDLGGVRVGHRSGDVTLVFKNAGTLPTGSLSYQWGTAKANTPDAEFIMVEEDTSCAGKTALAAGATCTVTVYFRPSGLEGSRGPKRFTLSAAGGETVEIVDLQGFALAADASAWIGTAGDVDGFYSFPGMTPSPYAAFPRQVFRITNETSASVDPALSITRGDAASFTLVQTGADAGDAPCGALTQLGTGESCTFAVGFTPEPWSPTNVYRHAVVSTTGLGAARPELGVYGRVQSPPLLTITPTPTAGLDPFNFGPVVVNTEASKAFTVTNTGESWSGPITLWSVANERFTLAGACGPDLAPGESCMANITFSAKPPAGVFMAEFGAHFATADGQRGGTYSSLANAEVVYDTTLTISPASVAFPAQPVGTRSEPKLLTLQNASEALTSDRLTIALGDPTNFSLVSTGDCPVAGNSTYAEGLAMGDVCTLVVVFTPRTLGTGTFATEVTISFSPGSTKTIPLAGAAVTAMHIRPEQPDPLGHAYPFGIPLRLTAWLEPNAPMTSYVKTTLTGTGYRIIQDQCVATKLNGGDSCEIWVVYLGTDTPLPPATLTVDGGAAGNSATVTLNGTGPSTL